MKKFLSGLLAGLLIAGLSVSALAISGRMTIDVDPINIQVNGETFVPQDVTGAEVPVFAYNGTTYAPLRALAEAYGLEVGYDAEKNMATVTDPNAQPAAPASTTPDYSDWSEEDEAAYQEFKAMWVVEETDYGSIHTVCHDPNFQDKYAFTGKYSWETINRFSSRYAFETEQQTAAFYTEKHFLWTSTSP